MKSVIWKHFKRDPKNQDRAICSICNLNFGCKDSQTTTIRKHLKCHPEQYKCFIEEDTLGKQQSLKRKANDASLAKASKQPKLSFDQPENYEKQHKFDMALISFLSETGISFNAAGSTSFKNLINIACPKLHVKSPSAISKQVSEKAYRTLDSIRSILEIFKDNITSVGFTSDLWTSRPGNTYMSLTCSFIDTEFFLHRYVPFVKNFPKQHTGSNIALGLDNMIRALGLHRNPALKMFSVNDNASNYRCAIKQSMYLEEISCLIHTVQLSVKDSFRQATAVNDALTKTRKIAKLVHKSSVVKHALKRSAEQKKIKWIVPKSSCKTRWNTELENMNSILRLKSAISDLSMSEEWDALIPTIHQWSLIEDACKSLDPVLMLTKCLESESEPTINKVTERLYAVQKELETIASESLNKSRSRTSFALTLTLFGAGDFFSKSRRGEGGHI